MYYNFNIFLKNNYFYESESRSGYQRVVRYVDGHPDFGYP